MQWSHISNGEGRGGDRASTPPDTLSDESVICFMIAVDNFEHVRAAYGEAASRHAMECVRAAVAEWFGCRAADLQVSGAVLRGTLAPPAWTGMTHRAGRSDSVNRLLANPPFVTVRFGDALICLSLSGSWAVRDEPSPAAMAPVSNVFQLPFFSQSPGQGAEWAERYRADMAIAAQVLAAVDAGGTTITLPTVTAPRPADPAGGAAQLVAAWRPVGQATGDDILFYEMCPEIVARDGRRHGLRETREGLERLGLSAVLDRHLVEHAIQLLESDPDVALCVQVSAQSVSACTRWGDVFRRLIGDRAVAQRLVIAITETSSFPDLAGAIQFVSRAQAMGCAVAVDNFGPGYAVEQFDSGAALLERARDGLSGCIVLDVRMPGVSGLEVQKRLASLDIHTPVIVVSGFADIAMAVQAMKANAFEFLTKPFRDQDLFDAIGAAMERDSSQAMQSRERRQADRLMRNLTAREHEVFLRLCNGQVGKQIAHELGMSEATVKVHRRSILHKLNVKHLGELILTYAPIVRMLSEEAN